MLSAGNQLTHMPSLKGRVSLVTGGASGIGREISLRLARDEASVVVCDINGEKAEQTAAEVRALGSKSLAIRADVSSGTDAKHAVEETLTGFGRIEILVNNAGIGYATGSLVDPTHALIENLTEGEWDRVMNVNLKGIFLCSKAVYPQMKKQGKGKIINVSSATFFMGVPFLSHYVASKGGVIALTRTMARELGDDNICVNAIAPGFTVSEALRGSPAYPEERLQMLASGRCFKRNEVSEDLTGTVVFLASPDSDFITGQTIIVDGGGTFV